MTESMLDDINADLSVMAESTGVVTISKLIAERWHIPATDVAPYIVAVSLQVALTMDATLIEDLVAALERATNPLYNAVRAAVAAEKVGWCQMQEQGIVLGEYTTATEFAANTFADEPETEH